LGIFDKSRHFYRSPDHPYQIFFHGAFAQLSAQPGVVAFSILCVPASCSPDERKLAKHKAGLGPERLGLALANIRDAAYGPKILYYLFLFDKNVF
jgi:hypothetical protein